MERGSNMSIKKSQLFTAVAMLLIAALALTTATMAWFVNNTKNEVENMNFHASTATGLEIAIHDDVIVNDPAKGPNQLDYKGILSNEDINKYYSKLEKDGKIILTTVSTVSCAAFYKTGLFNTENGYADIFVDAEEGTDYLMLPFWIRASEDMNLYLSASTGITVGNSTAGSSEYFDKILRMSFREMNGNKGDQSGDMLIYEPDGDPSLLGNRGTTTYDYASGKLFATEGMGISKLNGSGNAIAFELQNAMDGSSVLVEDEVGENEIVGEAGTIGKTKIAKLEAGIPKKIILYIWLDGMDFDCVAGVTGNSGDQIPSLNVDLRMIGVKLARP